MSSTRIDRFGTRAEASVRLEWGPRGAASITRGCHVAVVVDVLSFTTTLSVAADCGVAVLPCAWRDERAEALARERGAVLAVDRSRAGPGQVSLSPASVRRAADLDRLVLPSPNGSTISAALAERGIAVVGACLRNRSAVASWLLARRRRNPELVVALVAAGERWPADGSLRPAVEDLWGAGAVIAQLVAGGWTDLSPEAGAAAAAFGSIAGDHRVALRACVSGQELIGLGYADDVDTAAELDSSVAVPRLHRGVFTALAHGRRS